MTDELIVASQKAFCVEHAAEYVALLPESKLGFALSTKGKSPSTVYVTPQWVTRTVGTSGVAKISALTSGSFSLSTRAMYTRIIPRSHRSLDCHQASGFCSHLVLWTFGLMKRF
jgi:hypothetical protein